MRRILRILKSIVRKSVTYLNRRKRPSPVPSTLWHSVTDRRECFLGYSSRTHGKHDGKESTIDLLLSEAEATNFVAKKCGQRRDREARELRRPGPRPQKRSQKDKNSGAVWQSPDA